MGLERQAADRKLVDAAKDKLMGEHWLNESEAFTFIQETAMQEHVRMAEIAKRVLDGGLQPGPTWQ